MLIDTHCHVHFNAYKDDMDDVVRACLAGGVQMVTITGPDKGGETKATHPGPDNAAVTSVTLPFWWLFNKLLLANFLRDLRDSRHQR